MWHMLAVLCHAIQGAQQQRRPQTCFYNVARLRNYVQCQSKKFFFKFWLFKAKSFHCAHPTSFSRLSAELLRAELLRIFDHIQKVWILPLMSQMNKTLRPLTVAMTRPQLVKTILRRKEIILQLHLKERLKRSLKEAGRYLTIAGRAPQLL